MIHNIDPKGTVYFNGLNIPTILCHQEAALLGLASNHIDILHWLEYYGKTMDNIRDDVAKLLNNFTEPEPITADTYQINVEVNKYINAIDAKAQKNSKGILKPGEYYIYSAYPNGYQGMINLTTDPTGKKPGSWVNPAENVLQEEKEPVLVITPPPTIEDVPEPTPKPEVPEIPETSDNSWVSILMSALRKLAEIIITLFAKEK